MLRQNLYLELCIAFISLSCLSALSIGVVLMYKWTFFCLKEESGLIISHDNIFMMLLQKLSNIMNIVMTLMHFPRRLSLSCNPWVWYILYILKAALILYIYVYIFRVILYINIKIYICCRIKRLVYIFCFCFYISQL